MIEPVDLELLRAVLTQIDETGSYPVGGVDADELVKAARAYAAIGTPALTAPTSPVNATVASAQLLSDLAHMCFILKNNHEHNAGTQAGEAFKKMHEVASDALALLSPKH